MNTATRLLKDTSTHHIPFDASRMKEPAMVSTIPDSVQRFIDGLIKVSSDTNNTIDRTIIGLDDRIKELQMKKNHLQDETQKIANAIKNFVELERNYLKEVHNLQQSYVAAKNSYHQEAAVLQMFEKALGEKVEDGDT